MRWICIPIVLALSAPAAAQPAGEDTEVTSYRAWTIAADGFSTAAVLGGIWALSERGDNQASNLLIPIGAVGFLATPVIHAARGHGERALASAFLLRGTFVSIGMMTGVAIKGRCDGLFCELDAAFLGAFGGIVAAAVVDSVFLTSEVRERAPALSPQLAASRDGVRVGFSASF